MAALRPPTSAPLRPIGLRPAPSSPSATWSNGRRLAPRGPNPCSRRRPECLRCTGRRARPHSRGGGRRRPRDFDEDLPGPPRGQPASRSIRGHPRGRSEEHTSELQSPCNIVCRLLLDKKKQLKRNASSHPMILTPPRGQPDIARAHFGNRATSDSLILYLLS